MQEGEVTNPVEAAEALRARVNEHKGKLRLGQLRVEGSRTVLSRDGETTKDVDEYAKNVEYLSGARETAGWVISLAEAGTPDALILRAWDILDEKNRQMREGQETKSKK